jgi:hypothetical protein
MKPETKEPEGRDDDAGTTQLYRLICISIPGKKAGRRISGGSVKAAVQTGKHRAGFTTPGQEGRAPAEPAAPDTTGGNAS